MAINSTYAAFVELSVRGESGLLNEGRGVNLTSSGTISTGTDADGDYLSSAGSPAYLSVPGDNFARLEYEDGCIICGKIKTSLTGTWAAIWGAADGTGGSGTHSVESVLVNLSNITGTVLNGCIGFFLKANLAAAGYGRLVRTGDIGINDGAAHTFAFKWIKSTNTYEIWVDGVSQTPVIEGTNTLAFVQSTAGDLARPYALFARNTNGTIERHFAGKVYTMSRISSSDFDAEALCSNPYAVFESVADTTPPALNSAAATATGPTTASGSVTTDEGNGTLYSIATTSATAPSKAQVKAGQDHTGSAAVWDDSQAVSSTGAKSVSVTGLTAETTYYLHHMHEDAATNQSDVVSSASFTTTAAFVGTISVTDAIKNNTGTVLASQSGIKVAVLAAADLASVYEGTATTSASGILSDITNAAIVAGSYHVAIKLTDGSVGITGAIEAV